MIIEAGYDLGQVLQPELFADDESRRAVFVLAMDENLRELFVRKVCAEVPEPLEHLIPDLVTALRYDYGHATYFALAHMLPQLGNNIAQELSEQDEVLRSAPELVSHHLLGRIVFDGRHIYSSAPRYSFRDYPGLNYLPRAAVIHGPHQLLNCGCLACTQHETILTTNRRRYESGNYDDDFDD